MARHSGYVVALKENLNDEDSKHVIAALRMIKGVIGVEPVEADHSTAIARMQVRNEITQKLWDVLHGGKNG